MMNPTANQFLPACLFQIYIVYNKRTGKPRGYAFIEYEHERDMHCEYPCRALSQNHSIYDHMFMKTDLCDMQVGSSVEPHFLLFFMDVFVIILGWQLSLTPKEGGHYLLSKLMVMASKESDYFLTDVCSTICMLKSESGGCVTCVSVWCVSSVD